MTFHSFRRKRSNGIIDITDNFSETNSDGWVRTTLLDDLADFHSLIWVLKEISEDIFFIRCDSESVNNPFC